jgi:NitT/TauT family transport system substrate-binding protein
VLDQHGIVPGVDVEIITNLAFTTTAGAFIGGIGDFTAEFDPSALEIEKTGQGRVVAGLADFTGALPYTVYIWTVTKLVYFKNGLSTLDLEQVGNTIFL